MKRNRLASCIFVCWLGVLVGLSCPTFGVEYWAFSLQQAEKQIANNGNMIAVAKQLGGITDPLAIVFDEQTKDLVLVGRKDFQSPSLSIEDFIVALRAIMVHHQWPLVSIDKDENSYQTKRQKVRYEGGIEDTAFGNVLLQADVVLKKIGLGEINAQVWGVSSYFDLLCGEVKEKQTRGNIRATFWFVGASAHPSGFAAREGTMLLEDGQLVVRVAVRMGFQETHSPKPESGQDSAAAQFAEHLSNKYDDLAQQFPILQRLRTLYKMVALAAGIYDQKNRYSSFQPDLSFWLQKYSLTSTLTPREYPLVEKTRDVEIPGKTILVSLDGGVELRPLLLELEDGSISAFRDVVVKCRPNPSALVWRVPLEYWKSLDSMEGHFRDFDQKLRHLAQEYGDRLGTTLDAYIGGPRENFATPARQAAASLSPASFHHPIPKFNYNPSPNLAAARHIGGVMLSEVAQVEGTQRPEVQWAQGQFALVVEGQNAYIDPKLFRKFVTALWCVYYSDQDPGVSIDPIGPDIEKHLVRYIGRVVNTDLGRVMREADYVMKKWAVGTERPDYPGFQPVDGWMRHYGPAAIGISRRFWFVPEDIRFRRGGDLLLFDSGRMRLRTEYDVEGLRGQASPADQKFADFFTDHYQQLAQKYPIYKELFEYAQLVALAKYLKQNGVPLHWFLMAHKELVLTEDSPGTVDQLAKNSDYFQGMRIQGGVNLGTQAQYVLDREAVAALRKAWAQQASAGPAVSPDTQVVADAGMGRSAPSPSQPVSFAVHGKDYTVVPQGTATTGRDHRGLRYQTDLALRRQGKPALELVRYYNGRQQQVGHFGPGWDLLIPYRVAPANEKRRPFLNAIIPEQMVVENLLSGQKELLSFSTDRYSIAGYVPEKLADSQVIGLFLMSNGSFRLADKLGNQFHFDPAGRLTGMYFSPYPDDHMEIEYVNRFIGSFVRSPYRVRPAGDEMVEFLNVRLPKRVRITDQIHQTSEVLAFDPQHNPVGYVPEKKADSRYRLLALVSDGSLHLVDRHGNQVRFTAGWDFEAMLPSPDRPLVRSIQMGGQKVEFAYTLSPDGQMVVAMGKLIQTGPQQAETAICTLRYEYDTQGRLCNVVRHSPAGSSSSSPSSLQARQSAASADSTPISFPNTPGF